MSSIPGDLRYSEEHEWIRVDGDLATVGITDYAQDQLGDVVFVELPEVGRQVKQAEEFAVVESVKAASDIYSPLSGEVVQINENLTEAPDLINKAPYEEGWICTIKLADPSEVEKLLTAEDYVNHIEQG